MNDIFRVSADGRHADGGERRPLHAGVLVRAVAGGRQHAGIHRDRSHLNGLVAERPQPHRREPDLVGAPERRVAALRGGDEGRRPRRVADVERRREGVVLRVGQERERKHLDHPADWRRGEGRDVVHRRARDLADDRVRWKDDRVRARLRRLVARRRDGEGGARADHASRRRGVAGGRASDAVAGFSVARAVAGREEGGVRRARRRFRRVGARRRRGRAHHDNSGARVAARVGARQPPAGLCLEPRRAGAPLRLRFRRAHRDQAHRRPAGRCFADVVARRQIDRVRPRRQGTARDGRGDEAGPRDRHGPARPAAVPHRAADRLVARRPVDRVPQRRRGPVSESEYRFRERRRRKTHRVPLERIRQHDRVEPGRDVSAVRFVAAHGASGIGPRRPGAEDAAVPRRSVPRSLRAVAARHAGPAGAAARGAAARQRDAAR